METMTADQLAAAERVAEITRDYYDAGQTVIRLRRAQRAAIKAAHDMKVRQVELVRRTVSPDHPVGYTREHIRRITDSTDSVDVDDDAMAG